LGGKRKKKEIGNEKGKGGQHGERKKQRREVDDSNNSGEEAGGTIAVEFQDIRERSAKEIRAKKKT